jgi:hypothetical protein
VTAVAGRTSLRPRARIDAAVIGPGLALAAMIVVYSGLCCKDDRRRWEDGDKLDPISFMRRYRKER